MAVYTNAMPEEEDMRKTCRWQSSLLGEWIACGAP